MKYTPGPWEIVVRFLEFDRPVYIISNEEPADHPDKYGRVVGNMRLIAAAPEMYEALVHIVKYWDGVSESAVDAIKDAVETAEEALDKIQFEVRGG